VYGERRKRNIGLSSDQQSIQKKQLSADEYDWKDDDETELEEGYEEIEEYKENEDEELVQEQNETGNTSFLIDGKPFVVKQQAKKPTFQESHTRITTYLENNIYSIVKILQEQDQIESITLFINKSVKHYLMDKYQDNQNQ
jgi:hypothetical protein